MDDPPSIASISHRRLLRSCFVPQANETGENLGLSYGRQTSHRSLISNSLWDVDGISKREARLSGALLGLASCVSFWEARMGNKQMFGDDVEDMQKKGEG